MDRNSDEDVTFEDPDWVDKILARAIESAEGPSEGAEHSPQDPSDGAEHSPQDPSEGAEHSPEGPSEGPGQSPEGPAEGPGHSERSAAGTRAGAGTDPERPPTVPLRDDAPAAEPDRPRPGSEPPAPDTGDDPTQPGEVIGASTAGEERQRPVDPLVARDHEQRPVDPLMARDHEQRPVDPDDLPWSSEPAEGRVDEPTEAHGGWFDDDWDDDGDTALPENLGRGPSADEVIASWVNEEGEPADLLVDSAEEPGPPAPPKSTARSVAEWGAVIVGALLVAFLVKSFLVQAFFIPSESMVPTLNEGDRVLVNKLSDDLGDVGRGDIIVFNRPANETGSIPDLIKRVVAFEGETITFRDGEVYIDGRLLIEPYLAEESSTDALRTIPGCDNEAADSCAIPEGHLFVMGDNRRDSRDSRFFGPIDEDLIVGRAFVKIWPLGDIGGL